MSITLTNNQTKFINDLFNNAAFKAYHRDDEGISATYTDLRVNGHILDTIKFEDCVATTLYVDELQEQLSISPLDNKHLRILKICEICEILNISIKEIELSQVQYITDFLAKHKRFPHAVYMNELAACALLFYEYRQSNPTHHKWVR